MGELSQIQALVRDLGGDVGALLAELSTEEQAALLYDWPRWARPSQLPPPGDWDTWLVMAGRGFGKTRIGAQWLIDRAKEQIPRLALVGRTPADVRDVMVEVGPSSVIRCSPPDFMPKYEPTKTRLVWPNGVIATCYSAHQPEKLRGPAHGGAWCDEIAAWPSGEAWDMLAFGMREGEHPRCVATTTPKPKRFIREIMAAPGTVVTGGSLLDNADNLAPAFVRAIMARYQGTALEAQEIEGRYTEEMPGALWAHAMIDAHRADDAPPLSAVAVAVDPAATAESETGIVAGGRTRTAMDGHAYVLGDYTVAGLPEVWARRAVAAYYAHRADCIVAERNNGGDMVRSTIHAVDPRVPVALVWASRGKHARAEPVSMVYSQGRVHHVRAAPDARERPGNHLRDLEDQMCTWVQGDDSPDRMDALVWLVSHLMDLSGDASPDVGVDADREQSSAWE